MLAALSADNVVPTAMLQMESLGGSFLTSGEYAAKVPDYLRRCPSIHLQRLAVSVGWRKGDAASIMAGSSGGQAIALLSLCIFSLYKAHDAGRILFELSQNQLPASVAISSVAQLVDIGKLLNAKLETLGFGNLLAKQVTNVYAVYDHLGLTVPEDFLEPITTGSMVGLLGSISQALREENTIVRISGTRGLGHVLGLIMMMFPQDSLVTIDGVVTFEGPRNSIIVEFSANATTSGISHFQLESLIPSHRKLPIEIEPRGPGPAFLLCSFAWKNWVADLLQLEFQAFGLTCPSTLLIACCDMLLHLPEAAVSGYTARTSNVLPATGVFNSLGPYPLRRMYERCQAVLGTLPSGHQFDMRTAYTNLVVAATEALKFVKCSCAATEPCDMSAGWIWKPKRKTKQYCKRFRLWAAIGMTLDNAFCCFFVNAGTNTTVHTPDPYCPKMPSLINQRLRLNDDFFVITCESFHTSLTRTFSLAGEALASGSGSSVIFPVTLRDVKLTTGLPILYELVEGQIMFGGRYHSYMCGHTASPRPKAKTHIHPSKSRIVPTNFGEHSGLTMTVRECLGYLELRTTARVSGVDVNLNLESIIIASYGLQETEPCNHPMDVPLPSDHEVFVQTTSVASPSAPRQKVAIALTQNNPTAQLLCCEAGVRTLLLKDCCLNCALEQAQNSEIFDDQTASKPFTAIVV